MKGKRTSDDICSLIYHLYDQDVSVRQIAKRVNKHRYTVQRILDRKILSDNKQEKVKLGRRRTTTKRQDREIHLARKRWRFHTNRALATQFNVSQDTIRRRSKEIQLNARKAMHDVLTKRHRVLRIRWCRQHRETDFSTWFFSDEAKFELADCSALRQSWVHRKPDEKYRSSCVLHNPVKSRKSLMVWGCISKTGPIAFSIIAGTVNAQVYCNILENELIPALDRMPIQQRIKVQFQQDNAPPHSALSTQQLLQENAIEVPKWPALSPDLNPIENVWALMKRNVRSRNPQSIQQLREAVNLAWVSVVTPELCNRLYSSLPARIERVRVRQGMR